MGSSGMVECVLRLDYSSSVKSLSYMVSIEFLPTPLNISGELYPVQAEVVWRSEHGSVGAKSY